jgi:hypothetical protein
MQQKCPPPQELHGRRGGQYLPNRIFLVHPEIYPLHPSAFQSHAIGFCEGNEAFCHWYYAELKLTKT